MYIFEQIKNYETIIYLFDIICFWGIHFPFTVVHC
jgi:hypothetical protein